MTSELVKLVKNGDTLTLIWKRRHPNMNLGMCWLFGDVSGC